MIREALIVACTCEMSGRVRGKGFPARALPSRLKHGVGWIPANGMISALGTVVGSPFGALGDLTLVPDPAAELRVDFDDGGAPEHFFLGDVRERDGTPYACCPRDFLRRALASLEAETGLRLVGAFEHEFMYDGVVDRPGAAYSLDAWRQQEIFGEVLTAALRQAGLGPDSFLPEYGLRQFEVTCDPAEGLRAADAAVMLREVVRAAAHRLGHRASFVPIPTPDGVGNGVHIHFSFRDEFGRPATHDPRAPFGLSPVAWHFCAGVLHHLPALVAITAPCPVSYYRLRPNRWAPTQASLGEADRDTALRVCRPSPDVDQASGFNIEFRAADAAASPYMALGAIVHAGVDGIRRGLAPPEAPAPFPTTLGAALDALEACEPARKWLGPVFMDAYLSHKRGELALVADLDEAACCALYERAY